MIKLNRYTETQYPKNWKDANDIVIHLDGEVFFEIKNTKLKNITIMTDQVAIEVVGTQFNVRAYSGEGQTEIFVLSGEVTCIPRNGYSEITLSSRNKVIYEHPDGIIKTHAEEIDELGLSIAWETGELNFGSDSMPFSEVLSILERLYGVEFVIKDEELLSNEVGGKISFDNLSEVLEALSVLMNIEFRKISGVYEVSSNVTINDDYD